MRLSSVSLVTGISCLLFGAAAWRLAPHTTNNFAAQAQTPESAKPAVAKPDTGKLQATSVTTKPPILEIVRDFEQVYGSQPVLYVTEVHEVNESMSLKAVEAAFDWTDDLRIFDVNVPGLQHGILLGTRRWT